jgi:hypothetical protein
MNTFICSPYLPWRPSINLLELIPIEGVNCALHYFLPKSDLGCFHGNYHIDLNYCR